MTKRNVVLTLTAGLMIVLAGCASGPTPEELLAQGAAALSETESLQFTIERQGDPLTAQFGPGISGGIVTAEGVYQAPDSVYATVGVQVGSLMVNTEVIWNADGTFVKAPPLMPDYTPLDLGGTFEVSTFFSADGLPHLLTEDLTGVSMVSNNEDLEGVATYHLSGTLDAAHVGELVGTEMTGTATVDVWIEKDSGHIVRIVVVEEDGTSGWTIDLFGYGEPVEIPSP